MRKLQVISVLLGILLLFASRAEACGTVPGLGPSTPEDLFNFSSVIFIGEFRERHLVFQSTDDGKVLFLQEITFKIVSGLKNTQGSEGSFVKVRTTETDSSCGIQEWRNEPNGKQWLVYANFTSGKENEEVYLLATSNNGTSRVKDVDKQNLEFLGKLGLLTKKP